MSGVQFSANLSKGDHLLQKRAALSFFLVSLPSNDTAANLLFLDSPAGVGFSYSNTSLDVQGDSMTGN